MSSKKSETSAEAEEMSPTVMVSEPLPAEGTGSDEVGVSSDSIKAVVAPIARVRKQVQNPKLPVPKRVKAASTLTTALPHDAVQLEDKERSSSDDPSSGIVSSQSPIPVGRRQVRPAEAVDPLSPGGWNWAEETIPPAREYDSDEEKMAVAIANASFIYEPTPDISNHIYGGANLHRQENSRKDMEGHVFGSTVFEVAFEDLEVGNVVTTLVGSSWKGQVAPTGFFRVTGVDPVVVVAVIPSPVVPFEHATIRVAETDGKATCFVANNIGILKLNERAKKENVQQNPGLHLAIYEGIVAAKRMPQRTKAEATVPFPPATPVKEFEAERAFKVTIAPALRVHGGDASLVAKLTIGQTSLKSPLVTTKVLSRLTTAKAFDDLQCLSTTVIGFATILSIDPGKPDGLKCTGLSLGHFSKVHTDGTLKFSMTATQASEAINKLAMYLSAVFEDGERRFFFQIVQPLMDQLASFKEGALRTYKYTKIFSLCMQALHNGFAPFHEVAFATVPEADFIKECVSRCSVNMEAAQLQRSQEACEIIERLNTKSQDSGKAVVRSPGVSRGPNEGKTPGRSVKKDRQDERRHNPGGYVGSSVAQVEQAREREYAQRDRERNLRPPEPTRQICFAHVKYRLGVAGATPCATTGCSREHFDVSRTGISDENRQRLTSSFTRVHGAAAAACAAAIQAIPRA